MIEDVGGMYDQASPLNVGMVMILMDIMQVRIVMFLVRGVMISFK